MKLRGLYAITPESGDIADKVSQALEGGAALLQYRRKRSSSPEEARLLAALARRHGAAFIVNDDVALALAVDADGVHLGRDDGDVPAARRALKGKLLGVSCYDNPAAAREAVRQGADYVAFGSVFSSPTKPAAVRAPLALFRDNPGVPVCAIGGITLQNAPSVIAAGAAMVAVISDLFDAPDIKRRASQFKGLFS
jgi:thiamine-phosphate pyrophosphorylase